jgi:hypothetical protein
MHNWSMKVENTDGYRRLPKKDDLSRTGAFLDALFQRIHESLDRPGP